MQVDCCKYQATDQNHTAVILICKNCNFLGYVDCVKYLVVKAKRNVGEYRLTHSTASSVYKYMFIYNQ